MQIFFSFWLIPARYLKFYSLETTEQNSLILHTNGPLSQRLLNKYIRYFISMAVPMVVPYARILFLTPKIVKTVNLYIVPFKCLVGKH